MTKTESAVLHDCPFCGAAEYKALLHYDISVTSDSRPGAGPVSNRQCLACGGVFNASGSRFHVDSFYSDHYQLLSDSDLAEFVYQLNQEAQTRGINDQMIDHIVANLNLPEHGRLLEVGSGKGLFLKKFSERFPAWSLSSVEPSRNAQSYLARLVPGARFHFGSFQTCPFANETFDLVVSIGVLEHIPEPVDFARRLHDCTSSNGAVFISVPNFRHNPSDLIAYDHLSRFSAESLRAVLARAGLKVRMSHEADMVPMWVVAKPEMDMQPEPAALPAALALADAAEDWMRQSFEVYDRLGRLNASRRIGIYGTGIAVMGAASLTSLTAERIACFFDDNMHLHGKERLGRPVVALDQFRSLGITDICFSANPCYLPRLEAKVRSVCGDAVAMWPLPALRQA